VKFLVPLVFAFAGVAAGVGAGVTLRPAPASGNDAGGGAEAHGKAAGETGAKSQGARTTHGGKDHGGGDHEADYVSLGNQFIVPILKESRVRSLVVMAIDLEVSAGGSPKIRKIEPKLRDAFLTVLFDHANAGGFNGTFTSSGAMDILRGALREAGQKAVGEELLTDVLITSIVRQEF
jgi:flagellar FliL protein